MRFRHHADRDETDEDALRFGDDGGGIVLADAALPVRHVAVRITRAGEDVGKRVMVDSVHFLAERADGSQIGFDGFATDEQGWLHSRFPRRWSPQRAQRSSPRAIRATASCSRGRLWV
ncbi:hypothetical protein [Xanthomonas sacchari]|uniref:hypothetical protein n=1 Tax=Xanthomonas sacchari TaxID=56458 RepID=UPI001F2BF420|nr:hypothetical protein [Xanthomonas sacchari]